MGIIISTKLKSPVAKEAMKIVSLIATFKFEREGYYTSSEGDKLSEAVKVLSNISNRLK